MKTAKGKAKPPSSGAEPSSKNSTTEKKNLRLIAKALAASAAAAGVAYLWPSLGGGVPTLIRSITGNTPAVSDTFCPPHKYTTQIVSLDPLLIYLTDFVSPAEAQAIIDIGTPFLEPSPVTGLGSDTAGHRSRTSWSAPLPLSDSPSSLPPSSSSATTAESATGETAVDCIVGRAALFMSGVLAPDRDDMGAPQMVRYTAGQRFDLHNDWFVRPRLADADAAAGRRRLYNRVATMFVVLQADHTGGGETWFPKAKVAAGREGGGGGGEEGEGTGKVKAEVMENGDGERPWRVHEDGGLAFRAVAGNALFWVNLFPNGTGDGRVVHAGLPIEDGVKTAMNIWPRTYFGPDA